MNAITTGYLVEIPGLAEAVARSTPAPTHQLLDGMRAFEALAKPLARSCRQSQRHFGVVVLCRQIDTRAQNFPLEINKLRPPACGRQTCFVSRCRATAFRVKAHLFARKVRPPQIEAQAYLGQRGLSL